MAYTNLETTIFSQIAYLDLDYYFTSLCATNGTDTVSISTLLSKLDQSNEKVQYIYELIGDKDISDWKMSAVMDNNDQSGFYACVIETGGGDAAVAFRGSESLGDIEAVVNDWMLADLGLMNDADGTNQHAVVDTFLLNYANLLDGYDNITMTGHSLGGNLAEYATLKSIDYGLDDNIEQCVSLDGPGFSDEFIEAYAAYIFKMEDKLVHYQWSFVGEVLTPLGTNRTFIEVEEQPFYNFGYNFTRHDTKNITYDGENYITGEQDMFSKVISTISKAFDDCWYPIGDVAVWFLGGVLFITIAIKTLVVATFDMIVGVITEVFDLMCDTAQRIYNMTVSKITEIKTNFLVAVTTIKNWWNENFNAGYIYSSNNPEIIVDTYKLKSYSNRISAVKSRIAVVDDRIDSLYWKIGFTDLWSLLQADLLTGYSWRLTRCINYLDDVADLFETAENNITNAI
ncbi:MAG: Mbeg1-like protein [Clostridia bacterium]